MFLAANPALRTEPGFVRDWTALNKCQAWSPVANDEFRAAPFLRAGAIELAAGGHDPVPAVYELRLDRTLGRYDAAKQEFALQTLGTDDVLSVTSPGFRGDGQGFALPAACAPTSGRYPVEFAVTADNSQVANGLPMAPDAAAAFALGRANDHGGRDNHVVVDITVRLTLGIPRPALMRAPVNGVVVPVTAHIEDVTVEDGTPQRRPLYRLTSQKRDGGNALAAELREQARAETAVKLIDLSVLQAQFDMERAGAKVGPEPFRLEAGMFWTQRDGRPGEYTFPVHPSTMFGISGGVPLRFDNADEVAALAPTPDLAAALGRHAALESWLVYVPVGASDDPFKGGRFLVGHVLALNTVDLSAAEHRVVSQATLSPPAPWKAPEADARLAAAFDVVGIRTGMTPDQVIAAASSELGQKLAFDEARGEVRSATADCDFDYRRGKAPPLGRRCLVGTFTRTGEGASWTLTRLRLTQSLATDQQAAVVKAMTAKYGTPDLQARWDPPATLADAEGTEPTQGVAVGWGARLSNGRLEPDHVPFPVHAFEMKARSAGGVTVLTLTAFDLAATTAATEAAATEARRAGAAVPTKF